MKLIYAAVLVLAHIFLHGVTAQEEKCKTFDSNGPYCSTDTKGVLIVQDFDKFCNEKGFEKFDFGNGPDDLNAYCGEKDNGGGYRFNCCN
ncbi:hypothetical protein Bhyg_11589 [Pseudolycoriella hygida]|uniref:Plethodontid modulating factor n=1 Tax=Pseudolycoriella hygida TaxID=35572 RepID=A0A9Q0S035_9DIPT|nr:hypothetical protein Bhyg_11589 [Pseudolycoriella hygida]